MNLHERDVINAMSRSLEEEYGEFPTRLTMELAWGMVGGLVHDLVTLARERHVADEDLRERWDERWDWDDDRVAWDWDDECECPDCAPPPPVLVQEPSVLARALHRLRHEHGDLWNVEPMCGCTDFAALLEREIARIDV
jgi:hypothetical protein